MSPTEHQKKEWVEGIKRDFPRLAAQEDLVKMMVDVYASNPKHVQNLASKLQRQQQQPKAAGPAAFPEGIIHDAVRIVDTPFANADDASENKSSEEDSSNNGQQTS